MTKPTNRGKEFADVNWPLPVVADNLEHDVFCDHEEGSRFRIGTYRIKCTVTSDANEYEDSAGCDFLVTVIGE